MSHDTLPQLNGKMVARLRVLEEFSRAMDALKQPALYAHYLAMLATMGDTTTLGRWVLGDARVLVSPLVLAGCLI